MTPAACIHDAAREGAHGGKSRRRHADDHRQLAATRDDAAREGDRLLRVELGRLAHDAEDGETVHAAAAVELDHPLHGGFIDPPVVVEGRDGDDVDARGGRIQHGG
jgi:hypothetical protein